MNEKRNNINDIFDHKLGERIPDHTSQISVLRSQTTNHTSDHSSKISYQRYSGTSQMPKYTRDPIRSWMFPYNKNSKMKPYSKRFVSKSIGKSWQRIHMPLCILSTELKIVVKCIPIILVAVGPEKFHTLVSN